MGTFNVDEVPVTKPEALRPTPKEYRGIAIDSKRTPISTIITAIRGRRQIVPFYYSQALNRDNETGGHRINGSGVYQGYKRIRDLEMKVEDPIPAQPSIDTESREAEVTGTANLYPGLIPNTGDEFIMELRDGRMGIFVIQEVKQNSIYSRTTYTFSYFLRDFWTQSYQDTLDEKVIESYTFIRDNLDTGLNPIITDEAYVSYQELMTWKDNFPDEFLTRFYDKEYDTLLVPDQYWETYDPFHVKFCIALFGEVNTGIGRGVGRLNITNNLPRTIRTIHDAILDFTPTNMDEIFITNSVINKSRFINNPTLLGTRFIPVKYVVFPEHYAPNLYRYATGGIGYAESSHHGCDLGPISIDLAKGKYPAGVINKGFGGISNSEVKELVPVDNDDYKLITTDNFYIFSEAFYRQERDQMSLIERMVSMMIDDGTVEYSDLLRLIKESYWWPNLERFYYQPFLYAMINYALRTIE